MTTSSPPALESLPACLTVEEAAALLRVNRQTLYEAIRLGRVPGVHPTPSRESGGIR
jgi:hypothetical protein